MSIEKSEITKDVEAGDLIEELTQITSEHDPDKKPLLPLRRARVWGNPTSSTAPSTDL